MARTTFALTCLMGRTLRFAVLAVPVLALAHG